MIRNPISALLGAACASLSGFAVFHAIVYKSEWIAAFAGLAFYLAAALLVDAFMEA